MNKENLIFCLYSRELELLDKNNELFTNKNFIKKIISINHHNIKYVPNEILKDEIFFLELFSIAYGKCIQNYLSFNNFFDKMTLDMKKNNKFLLKLIKINLFFFNTLIEKNCLSKKLIIKIITKYPYLIIYLNSEYKLDKDFVLLSLKDDDIIKNKKKLNYLYRPSKIYGTFKNDTKDFNLEEIDKNYYHYLINDKDLKFKSYNFMLKYGLINIPIHLEEKFFEGIKKLDYFEFFRKGNLLAPIIQINNTKIVDFLILKQFNGTLIEQIYSNNNKLNIITYFSNINTQIKSNYKNYVDKFHNIINSFNNKNDIIIFLLKKNDYIWNFVKNNIIQYKKCFTKEIYKTIANKSSLKINEIIKHKYHNVNNKNNFNILFLKAIKSKKFINFILNKDGKHITKNSNIYNNKLTNKLFYYASSGNNLTCYLDIPIRYFQNKFKIIKNKKLYKYFIINRLSNFAFIFRRNCYDIFYKKKFLLYLIRNGCEILKFLNLNHRNDKDIVYESLKVNINLIEYANVRFLREFVNQNFDLEKTFENFNV